MTYMIDHTRVGHQHRYVVTDEQGNEYGELLTRSNRLVLYAVVDGSAWYSTFAEMHAAVLAGLDPELIATT